MSFQKAREHLIKYNLQNRIIKFDVSTATVKEAANALGSTEGEIAKSLGFIVDDNPILIIVAGDKKVNSSKYKNKFNEKAKMIPFDLVEDLIGHKAGGVCPFGIKENVKVYLDESLKQYSVVYPACGDHNSAVKLLISELEIVSNYIEWINVCN